MWTMDLGNAATTQLTFAGPVEFYPVCAPNGRDIALAALKPSNPNLFRQSLSAPGQLVPLFESPLRQAPYRLVAGRHAADLFRAQSRAPGGTWHRCRSRPASPVR